LLEAMRADKKAQRGKLRFVLSEQIGRAKTYEKVPEKLVLEVLRFAPQFLASVLGEAGRRNG